MYRRRHFVLCVAELTYQTWAKMTSVALLGAQIIVKNIESYNSIESQKIPPVEEPGCREYAEKISTQLITLVCVQHTLLVE